MSATQNLTYSVIQVVHNLGAVAVVGGSLAATRLHNADTRKKLARLALGGWAVQAASGAAFGAVSYYFYGRFPDISGIAIYALVIKMVCAAIGFLLLAAYLFRSERWKEAGIYTVWIASLSLAVVAISSAAFLRWFA
jgi:uncharacterized membrane protein YjjP (DUF1212 family)